MMRPDELKGLIETVLKELGPLNVCEAVGTIEQSPILSMLLVRDDIRFGVGVEPHKGGKWLHISGAKRVELWSQDTQPGYAFVALENASLSPVKFVDLVVKRRAEGLERFLAAMEKAFVAETGCQDARGWNLVILRGEWLRETVAEIPNGAGTVGVFLDGTFAFRSNGLNEAVKAERDRCVEAIEAAKDGFEESGWRQWAIDAIRQGAV